MAITIADLQALQAGDPAGFDAFIKGVVPELATQRRQAALQQLANQLNSGTIAGRALITAAGANLVNPLPTWLDVLLAIAGPGYLIKGP